jgi:hypothetical protein
MRPAFSFGDGMPFAARRGGLKRAGGRAEITGMTPAVVALGAKLAGTILVLAATSVGSAIAARLVARWYGRNRAQRQAIYAAVAMSSLLSAVATTWLLLQRMST